MRSEYWSYFQWPIPRKEQTPTVGEALYEMMAAEGWEGVEKWKKQANDIAPTLVGGSKKHGGADLGPTRAKKAWKELGVNGKSLADALPKPGFSDAPKLTVEMAAVIQGFPRDWKIMGKKTAAYRQVGNAFPPPVATALGRQIAKALRKESFIPKPGIALRGRAVISYLE